MGVRGLESFMERYNISNGVNIVDLIRQHRTEKNCTPIIVVDGMSIMRYVYKFKNLSWIYGGQMKEYEEILIVFINTFLNEGAELVFYFDGPCVITKRETWVKRRMDTLERVYAMLDDLSAGRKITYHENNERLFILPASLKAQTVYIAKKCNCKVFTSTRECDLEIAEYAAQNRCMAILAQDSDFAIFDSARYYLSMKNFNFNKMTTTNYDRNKLIRLLHINKDHLPLFASLIGNDVISVEELKSFHLRTLKQSGGRRIDYHKLYFPVANFVSSWLSGFDIDDKRLQMIAVRVFSDSSKASLIQDSLLSYDLTAQKNKDPGPPSSSDENWNNILKKTHELNKTADIPSLMYSIIVLQEYPCSTCVEDYRLKDIPASQTILKPIRERFYGVLLHEKPTSSSSETCQVHEIVVCSDNSLDEPVYVKAISPKVHHPGLLALWNGKAAEDSWKLIGDIFEIDYQQIQALPPIMTVPALTIRYIHERVPIERWELKALVSSMVLVHMHSAEYLSKIYISHNTSNTRPIRLFTLVSRSYSTTQFVFQGLGNPIKLEMIQPSNYQDGKFFHYKYYEAQNVKGDLELLDRKELALQLFDEVMEFILGSNVTK